MGIRCVELNGKQFSLAIKIGNGDAKRGIKIALNCAVAAIAAMQDADKIDVVKVIKEATEKVHCGAMEEAVKYIVQIYPCDLISHSELRQAVRKVVTLISGVDATGEIGKKDGGFLSTIRAAQIVDVGVARVNRVGEERKQTRILALRNAAAWLKVDREVVKQAYNVRIDSSWVNNIIVGE